MKRFGCFFLAFLLLLLSLPLSSSASSVGDVNRNETVSAADALLALQHTVRLIQLSPEQISLADVDRDEEVNAKDALLILQYTVKLISAFPADANTVSIPWAPHQKAVLQSAPAESGNGVTTLSQAAHNYTAELDLPSDSVMLYIPSIQSIQKMHQSWSGKGRDLSAMIMAGRDGSNEYFTLYPGREKKDVHTNADGSLKLHSGIDYYMLPTRHYIQYKLDVVKAVCELNPTYLAIEEPEVFVYATYAEGFKEEWEDYYGTPWQDPLSSSEARYKASRLITHLWVSLYRQVHDYLKENHPEIKLLVAAHDVLNYDHHQIVSCLSALTSAGVVDGIIGQTWSDCIYGAGSAYGGGYPKRLFERAWIEYASYADTVESGQELFTLSDAKADGEGWGWDVYENVWKLSVVTQLLQSDLRQYQTYIWPHRAFSEDTPAEYRTQQLAVFSAMKDAANQAVDLYAGTEGISLAMSDTLTWQYGSQYMPIHNTQDGIHSLSLPLIELGIPLTVTNLDKVTSAQDLAGIRLLLLSYDIQKPLSEQTNRAIADWVREGGTVWYVGGHDAAEAISGEWWSDLGQTPLENLLNHLGISAEVSRPESNATGITGENTLDGISSLMSATMAKHTASFQTGETSLLSNLAGDCLGFEAQVGQGKAVILGLPSSFFAASESGPCLLWQMAEAIVQHHTKTTWAESNLMVAKRGRYVVAQALHYTQGERLSGHFIDIFHPNLPVVEEKILAADQSALLYDISDLLTPGTPRLGFLGGESVGDVTEQADSTSFSFRGPNQSVSAIRLLGNGRTPKSVRITCDGQRYEHFTQQWDSQTGTLLLKVDNAISPALTVTVEWGDEPLEDTPPYRWIQSTYTTNSGNADAAFLYRNTATAQRTMRRVVEGELVYRFDLSEMQDAYLDFWVGGNYRVELSTDDTAYHLLGERQGDVASTMNDRSHVLVFSDEWGSPDTLYIRLTSCEETPNYGGALFEFSLYQKEAS